jgi:HSP20 family protein
MFYPLFKSPLAGNWSMFDMLEGLTSSMPRLEAYEEDDKLFVRLELPGYEKGNISVASEKGILTISANNEDDEDKRKGRKYLAQSAGRRSFSQSLVIPQGYDESKTEASYEAGILSISLPRSVASKGRRIDVR